MRLLILWEKCKQRLQCRHVYYIMQDEYHEELRGHYDEYICTRHVMVFRCIQCRKRLRVVRTSG